MLKLAQKLNEINALIEKAKTAQNTYKIKITENNKALVLNKNTLKTLNENGIKLEKVYISYNKNKALYNAIENILRENSDIFTEN